MENTKKERKRKALQLILLLLISIALMSLITLSFGYLSWTTQNEVINDLSVTLSDNAKIEFEKLGDLSIDANLTNFSTAGANLETKSSSTVTLTAEKNYSSVYDIIFEIEENNFVYTTEEQIAELILIIDGPNGAITEIDGLNYVSHGDIKGFDITTKSGEFTIVNDHVIELLNNTNGTDSITDEWNFTLYFINLETNQNDNMGKTFLSKLTFNGSNNTLEDLN